MCLGVNIQLAATLGHPVTRRLRGQDTRTTGRNLFNLVSSLALPGNLPNFDGAVATSADDRPPIGANGYSKDAIAGDGFD